MVMPRVVHAKKKIPPSYQPLRLSRVIWALRSNIASLDFALLVLVVLLVVLIFLVVLVLLLLLMLLALLILLLLFALLV